VSSCDRRLLLGALLGLAACGRDPRPFAGNPGLNARRLAVPFAIRLAVIPPEAPGLDPANGRILADALVEGLQREEVPALATDVPLPLDWRLTTLIDDAGAMRRPRYVLTDADGREQGVVNGQAFLAPTPAILRQSAAVAVPQLTRLMLSIQAARAAASPGALAGAQPRIRFLPVRGAPGDGAQALARHMRSFMSNLGWVVQDAAEGAEYGLTAEVRIAPARNNEQIVDLQWIVTRRDGQELGRVVQVEGVPAGRLDRFWGDIAYVAAEQAAGSVLQIVRNATTPG
jgi:hypothetical protein